MLQIEGLEVWFQRASDCVRKLISGDVDMAIVGYDMVKEFGKVRTGNPHSPCTQASKVNGRMAVMFIGS